MFIEYKDKDANDVFSHIHGNSTSHSVGPSVRHAVEILSEKLGIPSA